MWIVAYGSIEYWFFRGGGTVYWSGKSKYGAVVLQCSM